MKMNDPIEKAIAIRRALMQAKSRGDAVEYERLQMIWDGLPSSACKRALAVPLQQLVGGSKARSAKFTSGIDQRILSAGKPKARGYRVLSIAKDGDGLHRVHWFSSHQVDAVRGKPGKIAPLTSAQARALMDQLRRDGSYTSVVSVPENAGDSDLANLLRTSPLHDSLASGDQDVGSFAGLRMSDKVLSTTMAIVAEGTGSVETLGTGSAPDDEKFVTTEGTASAPRRRLRYPDETL
jgi:hypothetical protein